MLACSVPACIGLAIDAGHRGARRVWRVAAALGVLGLIAHVFAERLITHPHGWERLEDPLQFSSIAVGCVTLVSMGRMAWELSHRRPHERSRWVALSVMFVAMPVLQLGTDVLASPTSVVLLATGGGLIVGTMRALCGQVAPEYEEEAAESLPEPQPEALEEAA
jgi:divalent metal cation (Fe/Co/Zn/Cd) transporter